MKKNLWLILAVALVAGCRHRPAMHDVRTYGTDDFISEVLAFKTGGVVPKQIARKFAVREFRPYMAGVLLVYSESRNMIEGIYVDPKTVENMETADTEVIEWHEQIAWLRIRES